VAHEAALLCEALRPEALSDAGHADETQCAHRFAV